jgi:hypothetical protein
MVAMVALCESRIRYSRLLVHLGGGNLTGDVEDGRDSSGCCFHGVVDLNQSKCGKGLVVEALDKFKGSIAATSALNFHHVSLVFLFKKYKIRQIKL